MNPPSRYAASNHQNPRQRSGVKMMALDIGGLRNEGNVAPLRLVAGNETLLEDALCNRVRLIKLAEFKLPFDEAQVHSRYPCQPLVLLFAAHALTFRAVFNALVF